MPWDPPLGFFEMVFDQKGQGISILEKIFCVWGRPYMTSDGRGKGDFKSKGALIKHLMRGGGGSKNGKNHPTSHMDGPLSTFNNQKCITHKKSFFQ